MTANEDRYTPGTGRAARTTGRHTMNRPSPTPRIDNINGALDWMRDHRAVGYGELGDVCTLVTGQWEGRERAHDDAIARLWEQRFAAARLRDFLNWSERELDALDTAWDQIEAQAAAMYFEAEEVLGEDDDVAQT